MTSRRADGDGPAQSHSDQRRTTPASMIDSNRIEPNPLADAASRQARGRRRGQAIGMCEATIASRIAPSAVAEARRELVNRSRAAGVPSSPARGCAARCHRADHARGRRERGELERGAERGDASSARAPGSRGRATRGPPEGVSARQASDVSSRTPLSARAGDGAPPPVRAVPAGAAQESGFPSNPSGLPSRSTPRPISSVQGR